MPQELNEDICKVYRQKRQYLRELKIFNDAIVQRELSGQLQQKCDIPEIWALNIVNGYYMQDYLASLCIQAERNRFEGGRGKTPVY